MNETQKNMMSVLYDHLDSMFIGKDSPNMLLQMLPISISINPNDFANAISPTNMSEGALATAENFAAIVGDVPDVQVKFVSKGKIEDVYKWILNNAVSIEDMKEASPNKEKYEAAKKVLYVDGGFIPTDAYKAYKDACSDYDNAIFERESERIISDLSTPKGQQMWSLKRKKLDTAVNTAYDNLKNFDNIKNALNIMQTAFASGVTELLAEEKKFFKTSEQTSDTGKSWHICNAYPSDWYSNDSMYTKIVINQNTKQDVNTSKYFKLNADMNLKVGLFSSGDVDTTHTSESSHSQQEENVTEMEMEVAAVKIERPWLNETLLSLKGWKIEGEAKGHISDGSPLDSANKNKGVMPLIPKYMIIVRNVTLKGDFSDKLCDISNQKTEIGTSVGIGPFRLKGHTEFGNHSEEVKSDVSNNSITITTPQILGYISSVVPFSPNHE